MVVRGARPLVLFSVFLGLVGCKRTEPEAPPSPTPPPAAETPSPTASPEPPAPAEPAEAPVDEDETGTPAQMAFDRENLREHLDLLALTKKARSQLDEAVAKSEGDSPKAKAAAIKAIQKTSTAQEKRLASFQQRLDKMDPDGGRSLAVSWHRMNLQFLIDEYPASLVGLVSGDEEPITEVRAEMDRYQAKIEAWLTKLRQAP